MHPKYKDYLATMARWAKDGLISSDIIQNDQLNDMVVNNQVGAVGEWYSMHFDPLIKLREKVPEADYEVITPKSLSGNAYKLPISGIYGPETLFVSYSPNTEFAMKLYNWFMESPENYWTQKAGIQGEDWEWVDKNAQTYKTLKQLEKPEQGYNYAFSVSFYPPWNLFLANADAKNQMYYERQAFYLKYGSYYEPPDWFVTYNFKDTPVADAKEDTDTLLTENKAKIILGEAPVDEWDNVIKHYKEIYGDKYVELATEQYNKTVSK
jgi:putative aldouronate transport system substrate-binding protein